MKLYAVWSHSVAVGNAKIAQAFGYMGNNQVIQQDKQQACPCREEEQPLPFIPCFPFERPIPMPVKEHAAMVSSPGSVVELAQLKGRFSVIPAL